MSPRRKCTIEIIQDHLEMDLKIPKPTKEEFIKYLDGLSPNAPLIGPVDGFCNARKALGPIDAAFGDRVIWLVHETALRNRLSMTLAQARNIVGCFTASALSKLVNDQLDTIALDLLRSVIGAETLQKLPQMPVWVTKEKFSKRPREPLVGLLGLPDCVGKRCVLLFLHSGKDKRYPTTCDPGVGHLPYWVPNGDTKPLSAGIGLPERIVQAVVFDELNSISEPFIGAES